MQQLSSDSEWVTERDLSECRDLLRGGSRSFYAASFLLPPRVRDPAIALYAFCRVADDEIDAGEEGSEAVGTLRRRIAAAYDGAPGLHAPDRAFAAVVRRFRIPRELPDALIEGFAWDKAGRRYETIDDVLQYATRVAGSVGAMMSLLMNRRQPEIVARACDLGMAMQLTNIARDVGEDARANRLYLPRDWLAAEGVDAEAWLRAPAFTPEIARVVARLLDVADTLYGQADVAITALPRDCRAGISAARLLYCEIGNAVRKAGCNSVDARAVVPARRKAELLARALTHGFASHPSRRPQWASPADGLVTAVSAAPGASEARLLRRPGWALRERALFVIDLFERLERRERAMREQPHAKFDYSAGIEPAAV